MATSLAWLVAGMVGAGRGETQEPRATADGVYASAQADRGEREFGRSCEHCHGRSLEGDEAKEVPALAGDAFAMKWRGRPLKTLADLIRQSMPADNRGRLSARSYTDLVAFVLKANDFPAGADELVLSDVLDTVTIGSGGNGSGRNTAGQ